MRHVFGYLICLVFVTLVLTKLGLLSTVYGHSDAVLAGILVKLEADPVAGPTIQRAVQSADAAAHNPTFGQAVSLLGRIGAMALSPVGGIALVLYALALWILA